MASYSFVAGETSRFPAKAKMFVAHFQNGWLKPWLVVSAVILSLFGCRGTITSDPYTSFDAHYKKELPASATLLHSGAQYAGPDSSYGFCFKITDRKLTDDLINEFELTTAKAPGSFFAFAKHAWWPTEKDRAAMPEKYENVDDSREVYWSMWYDIENGRLYVEHGAW